MSKLDELRKLEAKATQHDPLPWKAIETESHKYMAWIADANNDQVALVGATEGPHIENERAVLIAALRNNAKALIACAEVLQHIDSKIGHFAKAPANDQMAVVSLIGDVARRTKEALRKLEE